MINKRRKSHPRAIQMAFLEACLLHHGLFRYKYLTEVFDLHEKEGIRLLADYRKINGIEILGTTAGITPKYDFTPKVLKRSVSAKIFLNMVQTIYSSEDAVYD